MFERQIRKLESLKANALKYCVQAALQNEGEITYLNSQRQLYDAGIKNDATKVGEYADSTKKMKRRRGLPDDRVTLYQSGAFHRTFRLNPFEDGVEFAAKYSVKGFDVFEHLKKIYGDAVMGLTDKNLADVINRIIQPFIDKKLQEAIQ